MKSYIKAPGVDQLWVPGVGWVKRGQVVRGSFDRLTPKFLVEVVNPPAPAPAMLTEPAPSIAPPVTEGPAAVIPESRLFEVIGDKEQKAGVQVLVEDGESLPETQREPASESEPEPAKRKPGRPKGSRKNSG